jgi:hypothetical protein
MQSFYEWEQPSASEIYSETRMRVFETGLLALSRPMN